MVCRSSQYVRVEFQNTCCKSMTAGRVSQWRTSTTLRDFRCRARLEPFGSEACILPGVERPCSPLRHLSSTVETESVVTKAEEIVQVRGKRLYQGQYAGNEQNAQKRGKLSFLAKLKFIPLGPWFSNLLFWLPSPACLLPTTALLRGWPVQAACMYTSPSTSADPSTMQLPSRTSTFSTTSMPSCTLSIPVAYKGVARQSSPSSASPSGTSLPSCTPSIRNVHGRCQAALALLYHARAVSLLPSSSHAHALIRDPS